MDALADSLSRVFPFPSAPFPTQTFKVLILGDCNVGKTTFISRFAHRARRQVMKKRRMQMQIQQAQAHAQAQVHAHAHAHASASATSSMSPMIVVGDSDSDGDDLKVAVPAMRLNIQPRERSKKSSSSSSPSRSSSSSSNTGLAAFRFGRVIGQDNSSEGLSVSTSPRLRPSLPSEKSFVPESTRSFTFGENSDSEDESGEDDESESESEPEDEAEAEAEDEPEEEGEGTGNASSMQTRRNTSSALSSFLQGKKEKKGSPLTRAPTFTSPTTFKLSRRRRQTVDVGKDKGLTPGRVLLTTLRFKRHSHSAKKNIPKLKPNPKKRKKRRKTEVDCPSGRGDENEGQEESSEEEEQGEEDLECVISKSESIREILVTPGTPPGSRNKSPLELNHHHVRFLKVKGLKPTPRSAAAAAAPPLPPASEDSASARRAKSASRSPKTVNSATRSDCDDEATISRFARERRHTFVGGPPQPRVRVSKKRKSGRIHRSTSPQMVISATTEEHSPVVETLDDDEYWHSLRKDSQGHLKASSTSVKMSDGDDDDLDDEDEIEKLEEEMMRVPDPVQIPARFIMAATYVSILKRPEADFGDFLSRAFAAPGSAVDGSRTPLVDDDFGIHARVKDRRRKLDLEQAHLQTFLEDGRRLSSSFSPITKTLEPDPEILSEELIHLNIWDISGAEQFKKISRYYLKNAHGAIFLFDLTNELSFFHFDRYLKMIRKHVIPFRGDGHRESVPFPVVVVGHQADRDDEKRLDDSEIRVLLVGHITWDDYFPTSSVCPKLRRNISHAFHRLIGKMLKLQMSPTKIETPMNSNHASPEHRRLSRSGSLPEIDPPEQDPGIVNLESPMPSEVVRLLRNFEEQVSLAEGTGKVAGCRFCQC